MHGRTSRPWHTTRTGGFPTTLGKWRVIAHLCWQPSTGGTLRVYIDVLHPPCDAPPSRANALFPMFEMEVSQQPSFAAATTDAHERTLTVELLRQLLLGQQRQNQLLEEARPAVQRGPAPAGRRAGSVERGQPAPGPQLPRSGRGTWSGADAVFGKPHRGHPRQRRVARGWRLSAQRIRGPLWSPARRT